MRQEKRIDLITNALILRENKTKVLNYWFTKSRLVDENIVNEETIKELVYNWEDLSFIVHNHWRDNPDLRLPQVLINVGVMPNYPGFYYHTEDEKTIIEANVLEAKEIMFWGNNYDENNVPLEKTRWVLAKEMTTDHLKAIIDLEELGKMKVSPLYLRIFKDELKTRNE